MIRINQSYFGCTLFFSACTYSIFKKVLCKITAWVNVRFGVNRYSSTHSMYTWNRAIK